MAPITRLLAKHAARRPQGPEQTRSRRDRANVVDLTQSPDPPVRKAPTSSSKSKPKAKSKAKPPKKPAPKNPHSSKKAECCLCIEDKSIIRNFKLYDDETTCEHLRNICQRCLEHMLSDNVMERKLQQADLACPFGACDHVLDQNQLRLAISKNAYISFHDALTKHLLSADRNFIACLNPKCGLYFNIEDCEHATSKGKRTAIKDNQGHGKGRKIACPHENCGYELCLECTRPWHPKRGCDQSKKREDEQSETEIKAMGAKPCPGCGANIVKQGGCDHMTCYRCHHDFCWQCLAPYRPNVQHAEPCTQRQRIGANPGNWVPADLTDAQVQRLIERTRADDPELAALIANPPPGFRLNFVVQGQAANTAADDVRIEIGNDATPARGGLPFGQPVPARANPQGPFQPPAAAAARDRGHVMFGPRTLPPPDNLAQTHAQSEARRNPLARAHPA